MKLTDINTVRQLLGEEQTSFKKKYGQNFLINENTVRAIAESCLPSGIDASKDCGVLEIGPGIGTLTYELCKVAKRVVSVEIDSTLIPVLAKTLAEFDNVKVINSDILKADIGRIIEEEFSDCGSIVVAANLPYYITTPILMHLFESRLPFEAITVMVQKEVADRLCSGADNGAYGAVTASVAYYAKAKKLFNVSAGNFLPAPKVDSAVVRFDLYKEPPVHVENEKIFFKVIRSAFEQRRKTLLNALSSGFAHIPKIELQSIIISCGLSATVRGEALDIAAFALIANKIHQYMTEDALS